MNQLDHNHLVNLLDNRRVSEKCSAINQSVNQLDHHHLDHQSISLTIKQSVNHLDHLSVSELVRPASSL